MNKLNELVFKFDGEEVEPEVTEKFGLRNFSRNLRFSYSRNAEVIDFVGFIIIDEAMLVVLPKNYRNIKLTKLDIELLFDVLWREQSRNPQKYIGPIKEFESSYPFHAFHSIYRYYQRYGLYQENETITSPGYNGKISWRDTLRKSSSIINKGNLLYLPLFIQKTKDKQVFLSECMSFAIEYTLRTYPYFVKGKKPGGRHSNFDFWKNQEYIIARLKKIHSEMFKDIHKRLVLDLIQFYSKIPQGGKVSIIHYNFELVWESMVEKYLNDYFLGVDNEGLLFSNTRTADMYKFTKEKFYVDMANPNHRLEPDHYFLDERVQLIFDSKYYSSINNLDHKQIVYQSILKTKAKETFNALLLPTSGAHKSKVHFNLKDEYLTATEKRIKIFEYYLNMKMVMENYVE